MINFRVRILKLASPLDGTKAIKEKKTRRFLKPWRYKTVHYAKWPVSELTRMTGIDQYISAVARSGELETRQVPFRYYKQSVCLLAARATWLLCYDCCCREASDRVNCSPRVLNATEFSSRPTQFCYSKSFSSKLLVLVQKCTITRKK